MKLMVEMLSFRRLAADVDFTPPLCSSPSTELDEYFCVNAGWSRAFSCVLFLLSQKVLGELRKDKRFTMFKQIGDVSKRHLGFPDRRSTFSLFAWLVGWFPHFLISEYTVLLSRFKERLEVWRFSGVLSLPLYDKQGATFPDVFFV